MGYGMTLEDMWYCVARIIYTEGFLAGGGEPEINQDTIIDEMAREFYRTTEHHRIYGPMLHRSKKPYMGIYEKLQPKNTYTESDRTIWLDTTWADIRTSVTDAVINLECWETSRIPDPRDMYNLQPDIVMGFLYSVAHIPSKSERDQVGESDGVASDSD